MLMMMVVMTLLRGDDVIVARGGGDGHEGGGGCGAGYVLLLLLGSPATSASVMVSPTTTTTTTSSSSVVVSARGSVVGVAVLLLLLIVASVVVLAAHVVGHLLRFVGHVAHDGVVSDVMVVTMMMVMTGRRLTRTRILGCGRREESTRFVSGIGARCLLLFILLADVLRHVGCGGGCELVDVKAERLGVGALMEGAGGGDEMMARPAPASRS